MELAPDLVTRSLELPASAEEVWSSLRSAEGLAGWLGDAVDLDEVVAGAAGIVREGATVRRLVVTEVHEGRSIGFVWWDESAPDEASIVTVAVTPGRTDDHDGDGDGSTVTVTERLAGSASASVGHARIGDLLEVEAGWDRRLQALVGERALTVACV